MSRENATAPKWLTPSEMVAWRKYIIASRQLLAALDADLKEHDLTLPDYEILALLSDAPDRQMRMSELAKIALLSRSRLSHRMKVMEKAGWLKREPCPVDKRGYFAVMTPKGWKAIVACGFGSSDNPSELASLSSSTIISLQSSIHSSQI